MSAGVEYAKPALPAPVSACCICMELWTSDGTHRICCIPCGHVYGRSCLESLLRHGRPECPQCAHAFESKNIVNLYVTEYPWDKTCHKKMWIYIKAFNGKTIALEVDGVDTIKKIKTKIQDREGIHTNHQCLILDSSRIRQLDDALTLDYYNICNGSTLHLLPSPDYDQLIFVKAFTGKTTALAVKSSDTIKNIKAMIRDRGIPTNHQCLIIDGNPAKQLEDDRCTLANYGVHNGSILHLLPAPMKGCIFL